MRDITREQLDLQKKTREANKPSNPPVEAEPINALKDNMADLKKTTEKTPEEKAREEKLNNTLLGKMRSGVKDAVARLK